MYQVNIVMPWGDCPLAQRTLRSELELSILFCNSADDGSIICLVQIVAGHPTTIADFFRQMRDDPRVTHFELVAPATDQTEFVTVLKYERHFLHMFKGSFTFLKPPIHVEGGSHHYTILAPKIKYLQQMYDRLDLEGTWEIEGITEIKRYDASELTPMQRKVIMIANNLGYFKKPKKANLDDVALAMNLSKSTVYNHLKRAEEQIIENYVERYLT